MNSFRLADIRFAFSDSLDTEKLESLFSHYPNMRTKCPFEINSTYDDCTLEQLFSHPEDIYQLFISNIPELQELMPEYSRENLHALINTHSIKTSNYLKTLDVDKSEFYALALEMQKQKSINPEISAETALKLTKLHALKGEISNLVNQNWREIEQTVRSQEAKSSTTIALTTATRHNCLYHSAALSLHYLITLTTTSTENKKKLLTPFMDAFNTRHSTTLSIDEFIAWINAACNNRPHTHFLEAVYAPTLRSIIHSYCEELGIDHPEHHGSESEIIVNMLSNALNLPIVINRTDGQMTSKEVYHKLPYFTLHPQGSKIASLANPTKHYLTFRNSYAENHFEALLPDNTFLGEHTRHSQAFSSYYQKQCIPNKGADPLIEVTYQSISMWEQSKAQKILHTNTTMNIHWFNIIVDFLFLLTVIGIPPVLDNLLNNQGRYSSKSTLQA
jgi:hypothetical protein